MELTGNELSPLHRTRLAGVEPVYGGAIRAARMLWRIQGLRFTVTGIENLPVTVANIAALMHTQHMIAIGNLPAELDDLPNWVGRESHHVS